MKNKKAIITGIIGFIVFTLIGLYLSSVLIIDILIILGVSFFVLKSVECYMDAPNSSKALIYIRPLWYSTIIAVVVIVASLLAGHGGLYKEYILKKPKIVGNSVCGILNNKPKCFKLDNISNSLKYELSSNKDMVVVKEYRLYNAVGRKIMSYYQIGDK
jgi:hypothetical protein